MRLSEAARYDHDDSFRPILCLIIRRSRWAQRGDNVGGALPVPMTKRGMEEKEKNNWDRDRFVIIPAWMERTLLKLCDVGPRIKVAFRGGNSAATVRGRGFDWLTGGRIPRRRRLMIESPVCSVENHRWSKY